MGTEKKRLEFFLGPFDWEWLYHSLLHLVGFPDGACKLREKTGKHISKYNVAKQLTLTF